MSGFCVFKIKRSSIRLSVGLSVKLYVVLSVSLSVRLPVWLSASDFLDFVLRFI